MFYSDNRGNQKYNDQISVKVKTPEEKKDKQNSLCHQNNSENNYETERFSCGGLTNQNPVLTNNSFIRETPNINDFCNSDE